MNASAVNYESEDNMNVRAKYCEPEDVATVLQFIPLNKCTNPNNSTLGYGNYAANKSNIFNILIVGHAQT